MFHIKAKRNLSFFFLFIFIFLSPRLQVHELFLPHRAQVPTVSEILPEVVYKERLVITLKNLTLTIYPVQAGKGVRVNRNFTGKPGNGKIMG